jgi:hypothetical protein
MEQHRAGVIGQEQPLKGGFTVCLSVGFPLLAIWISGWIIEILKETRWVAAASTSTRL